MLKIVYVVNVEGSDDDTANKYEYSSWINYLYAKNRRINFRHCPNEYCREKITDNNKMVGAHVYKCNKKIKKVYTETIFIAPICNSCNLENKGYDAYEGGEQDVYIMKIYEGHLIPHPKYKK